MSDKLEQTFCKTQLIFKIHWIVFQGVGPWDSFSTRDFTRSAISCIVYNKLEPSKTSFHYHLKNHESGVSNKLKLIIHIFTDYIFCLNHKLWKNIVGITISKNRISKHI